MRAVPRVASAIQRTLPDTNETEDTRSKGEFKREDVEKALIRGMFGGKENWPGKIRSDFTDKFEQFAEWAMKSEGFTIW